MVFVRTKAQTKQQKQVAAAALLVAAASAGSSFLTTSRRSGVHRGGDIGSMTTRLIFAAAVGLPVIVFLIVKAIRSGDDDGTRAEDSSTGTDTDANSDSSTEENEHSSPRIILLAVAAALIAIGLGMFAWAQTAHAQGTPDRGAFVVLLGSDTLVVDRFNRTTDSLTGVIAMKNQPRVEYAMALGPNNLVRSLHIKVVKLGALPNDPPIQSVTITMLGDSAVLEAAGTSRRFASKADGVPSINNAFAIGELFTRRARASGGSGSYSYITIAGPALPVTVSSVGADSMIVSIGSQQERFKVDAIGRILGGSFTGQPVVLARATAEQTARISLGAAVLTTAEKSDYSAPIGAPYTAEEVSFKGPGGITLGGTLTLPTNVRGPLPAAITITGSGQEDRDEYLPIAGGIRLFRQVADTLSRVGIAVLRLDDRGLGASTGNFATSTTADFADDIRAGLAYLRSRSEIDGNRLALIGHSEGGIIGPMVAATDPKVRALVTFGGPGDKMIEMSMAQNKWAVDHQTKLSQHERDSILIAARASLQPEKQTSPMIKFWMSYDPAPAARQVKAATLILQGENDRQVPVENAEKLAALIRSGGNKDVAVRIFPGTDHLFIDDPTGDFMDMYAHLKTNKVSPVILGVLADWMKVKLGAPATLK
jgi:pimeloyl-ACP methyl ester carboxylesterase